MTKKEHIAFWKDGSLENWDTALFLHQGRQFAFALFAYHLVMEKLLKAHWVKDNVSNTPPRIHDLSELYRQTDLDLDFEQVDYLNLINSWNLEGRYPDYKKKVHKMASQTYLDHHFPKLEALKKCLLEKL